MSLRRLLFFGWLGFILAASLACAGSLVIPGTSARELRGTQWQLNSYGPQGSEAAVPEGMRITMAFTGEDKIGGTDGCNTFSGNWKARFGMLTFRNLTSSMSVCTDQTLLHQEMEYLQALSKTDRYEFRGNQLTIWYGNGRNTLIFTRSQPPGLVGARLGKG